MSADRRKFILTWQTGPFLVNSNDISGHWTRWAALTRDWHDRGGWTARAQRIPPLTDTVWTVQGSTKTLYDPGADYLTFKAVQDGVVGIWNPGKRTGRGDDGAHVRQIVLLPPVLGKPAFTVTLEGTPL